MNKIISWVIKPDRYRKTLDRQSVTSLLITYTVLILTCSAGIFFAPEDVIPALIIGTPFLLAGYYVTRKLSYRVGGLILIGVIYMIAFLVVYRFDSDGHFGIISYCWLVTTIFIGIMFLDTKQILLLILLEYIVTFIMYFTTRNIEPEIFYSWLFFNSFFCLIVISLRLIFDYFRNELINHNEILDKLVEQRTEQLETNLQEKNILIRELYHRTKNNMQLIASLLYIQFSDNSDNSTENCVHKTSARINAMSLVHDKLYESRDLRFISLKDYLSDLLEHILKSVKHADDDFHVRVDMQDIKIPLEVSIPLGLIVNELLLNSFKHSKVENQTVHLLLFSRVNDNRVLELRVDDDGPGLAPDTEIESIRNTGLKIVNTLAVDQLKGKIFYRTDAGFSVEIVIPLDSQLENSEPYTHSDY